MDKFCKSCAVLAPNAPVCQLKDIQVDPEVDYCSKHTTFLERCEICGRVLDKEHSILQFKDNTYVRTVCEKCNLLAKTCQLCKHVGKCFFETDPSPIPKIIEKRIQQGPMITVMQIRNPERVDYCCKEKKCSCFSEEYNDCMKNYNYCENCEDI